MLWLILSLSVAFCVALMNVFLKKASSKFSISSLTFYRWLFSIPFLIIPLFFIKIPQVDIIFWGALIVSAIGETIAALFYIKAVKEADISLVIPILSFLPLALALTSFFILNELPTIFGFIGILFIVFGSVLLNFNSKGLFNSFKTIFTKKGTSSMIVVVLIISIVANFEKIAIQHSNPYIFTLLLSLLVIIFMIPWLPKFVNKKEVKQNLTILIGIGLLAGLAGLLHMIAINLAFVSYVFAVRRTDVLFTILLGAILFKEKRIKQRFMGAFLMFIGIVLLALF